MKDTKNKLLITAAKLFSRRGMDGVSTRELAKAANVNLCAISYYFGSKQKLYEAVIDDLIEVIKNSLRDRIKSNVSLTSPKDNIKFIIGNFFEYLCSDSVSDEKAMLMINETISPTKAYEKIYTQILDPVHKSISQFVAEFLDKDPNNLQVLVLTHTLFGQAVMFRIHKEALLRRLNKKNYDEQTLKHIRHHIEENCDAILETARRSL